jgi:hypothetical protein
MPWQKQKKKKHIQLLPRTNLSCLIKGNECKRSTRQRHALAAFADLGWLASTVCLHWVGGIAWPARIRKRFRG